MAAFADCLRVGLETRLIPALIALWPDYESASTYLSDVAAPMVESMGFFPVAASLNGKGQTPSEAFLVGPFDQTIAVPNRKNVPFIQLLEEAMDEWKLAGRPVVLFLAGIERWDSPRWRDDLSAFRSFLQANYPRLFVVLSCTKRGALDHLFLSPREPLYREGMIVTVQKDGTLG